MKTLVEILTSDCCHERSSLSQWSTALAMDALHHRGRPSLGCFALSGLVAWVAGARWASPIATIGRPFGASSAKGRPDGRGVALASSRGALPSPLLPIGISRGELLFFVQLGIVLMDLGHPLAQTEVGRGESRRKPDQMNACSYVFEQCAVL